MIEGIYRKPFQKSYAFIYPVLGFRRNGVRPEQTYLLGDNIEDYSLVCIYKPIADETWRKFEYTMLLNHPLLQSVIPLGETTAYIFNMSDYKEDLDNFWKGKYSKLSSIAKKYIMNYYNVTSPMFVYMESFLYPEKYIKRYSELLAVKEELLISVGELCEKPTIDKEICPYTITEEMIAYSNFTVV